MTRHEPVAEIDPEFSSPDAIPTPWSEAREGLEAAQIYWLATVRPDGRPHVTPLIAAWLDSALYFATGATERKARNLECNPHVVITTGRNTLGEGVDLVVEGDAVRLTDEAKLQRLADLFATKYGPPFVYAVANGAFQHEVVGEGGEAIVFEVAPTTAFGFSKGEQFSQTRWRFA